MATQENSSEPVPFEDFDRSPQALTIASCAPGERWAMGTNLAVGKITTQDDHSGSREGTGQSNQQTRPAIRSRSVREYQTFATQHLGRMQKPADGRVRRRIDQLYRIIHHT